MALIVKGWQKLGLLSATQDCVNIRKLFRNTLIAVIVYNFILSI